MGYSTRTASGSLKWGTRQTDLTAVPDLANYRELRACNTPAAGLAVMVVYGLGLYALFGLSGFVWGYFVSTVLLLHTTHWIQSMSHYAGGYQRFETERTTDRNHLLIGLFALGEWHNNHHYTPWSAKQGVAWWEPDVTWLVLRLWERLGLIWDVKRIVREP